MPRASRKILNKQINSELKENFAFLVSFLHNRREIEQFFNDFLTKEENLMLTKRLMLYLLFENKYKGVDIQSILGVSDETVRVHKNNWENSGETYRKIITKIASRQKVKLFFQRLEKKLRPLDLALKSKSDMRARAKFASGDFD